MITPMPYLLIPLAAIVFGLFFAPAAFASTPTQACTMQYKPVCAAYQVQCLQAPCYPVYRTYGNACMANVEKARFLHEGECTASETGAVQPADSYTPPASSTLAVAAPPPPAVVSMEGHESFFAAVWAWLIGFFRF